MREHKNNNFVINLEIFNLSHQTRIPRTNSLEYQPSVLVWVSKLISRVMVMVGGEDWSNLDNDNNQLDSRLVTGSNHGTSRPGRQSSLQASLIGSSSPRLQSSVLLLIVYGFHFCSVLGCFKMQLTPVMMWKRGGKSIIYKVPQLHKCCGGSRHCNAQTLMKPCADLEIMKVTMTDLVKIIKN